MAEKRVLPTLTYEGSVVKRPKTHSKHGRDPLSYLTEDQLVFLYTLMLCCGEDLGCIDHGVMGSINIMKTLDELCDKGLCLRTSDMMHRFSLDGRRRFVCDGRLYELTYNESRVMRYYVTQCLHNDMDKEFFLCMASERCLRLYAEQHILSSSEENCPITLMRLIVESEVERLELHVEDILPPNCVSVKNIRNVVRDWCHQEKLDPIRLADKIPNERVKSFYSASTILPSPEKETNPNIPTSARNILFCILLSSGYSITLENDNWRRKLAEVREKLCMTEAGHELEDLETINELVGKLAILRKTGQRITFKSENIKHKVMAEFAIYCLKTDKDYESYLMMTSEDSVIEYCTCWRFWNHTNERCIYIPRFLEDLLIEKFRIFAVLQANLMGMEDIFIASRTFDDYTPIQLKISRKCKVPKAVFNIDDITLTRFMEVVIGMGYDWVNLNSVLCSILIFHPTVDSEGSNQDFYGGFLESVEYNALRRVRQIYLKHQDDPKVCDTDVLNQQIHIEGGSQRLSLSPKEWATLIFILLADNYVITIDTLSEAKQRSIKQAFPLLQGVALLSDIERLVELEKYDKVLRKEEDKRIIRFASDEIRHQVMSYFVLNCLKTDEDYKNYIRLSSVDSLLEYVRPWTYTGGGQERCLYLTEILLDDFIEKLGLDAIRHVMVGRNFKDPTVNSVRDIIQKNVNVPREIFDLDYEARCRYVECAKKGTQTTHKARAMIVGCAGAGKTTLLKRLQKCGQEEINNVQTTVGLEIHEDIFEINDEENVLKALQEETKKEGKKLLSIVDFAGQCAYYACHQVYLSRRAFYLLVIDMSKPFSEIVDPRVCEQQGTVFMDWTYGEYVLFWMKSIHTYCDNDTPVIIVGTHLDKTTGQTTDTLFNKVLKHLEFNKDLTTHLDRRRCFILGLETDTDQCVDTIIELEKCMVSITKHDRWRETIPTDWALCEVLLREQRRKGQKMMSVSELTPICFDGKKGKDSQIEDVLKLYHDMGVVLYFQEKPLNETVIIDIQWFVDSFKNVITDPNHVSDVVENEHDWREFFESGHLQDRLLSKLLSKTDDDIHPLFIDFYPMNMPHFSRNPWNWNLDKSSLLQYMQRLGLIALGRFSHYIPSMNKRTFGAEEGSYFETLRCKTSVLVYKFDFLPYFYYFRLIVACLENEEWAVLENKGLCLYKNVACFRYKEHILALAVTRSSIQLQILQPQNKPIEKEVVLQVRDTVDMLLEKLTKNFHKTVMFIVGYQCSKQEVFVGHNDCFLKETDIYGKGEIPCPRHGLMTEHRINERGLLSYWIRDVLPVSERNTGACTVLEERDLPKFIKVFGKDIYIQALYLSLSENDIEIIKMESPNSVREQIYHILLKWKRKTGQGATIGSLWDALQQCENDTGTTVDWDAFHEGIKSIVDQTI
ncbi:uncharacterized protein LOC125676855 isoform X2 [Ostrea edulis]|uniref:uncharacterized protein LOC125676855 isoform X2 n=1 Tax=Ostrea edulis TaxID=37623 RepID=UPI0024AF3741|nr:uncharacterized protein LOC125676855 isoform X2 [Ostrea edulis]